MARHDDSRERAERRFSTRSTRATSASREQFPGDSPQRQPVHTVYGGAHLFKADAAQKLGALALQSAGRARARRRRRCAAAIGLDPALADRIYPRVRRQADARAGRGFPHRLRGRLRQPARSRRRRLRADRGRTKWRPALRDGTLPPSIGIRIKPLSEELKRRSLRTFDLFLTRAARAHATACCRRTSSSRCRRSPRPSRWRRWPRPAMRSSTGAGCRRARCGSS